jgi:hypothetical protein
MSDLAYAMRRSEVEEAARRGERLRCAATVKEMSMEITEPVERQCTFRAVMAWHGVPFCPQHAPAKRPGLAGWVRL